MTTRRQHYVWRKYLVPWTTAKGKSRQIWFLRRGSEAPIFTDVTNVAVERDFYRLRDLEEGDTEYVRKITIGPNTHAHLKDLNEGWISKFELILGLVRAARSRSRANRALLDALDKEMIEFQEEAYQRMEDGAVNHLTALQAGDVSFFEDEAQAISFSYFLATQYFRTKAMRDRIRDAFAAPADKARFDRTWPIFRYIFATNIGWEVFKHRKTMKLQVLQAAPDTEFMTGDQPAINTYGAFVPAKTPVEELELFYPVSPARALIISGHALYQDSHGNVLDSFRMSYLNQTVERIAYEQLFAHSKQTLDAVVPYFCGARRRRHEAGGAG